MAPPRKKSPAEPIFVNRDGPLARFAEAAADIPADGLRLLVFHGVGGQGKSALLRRIKKLAEPGPKQQEQFEHLRTAMLDLHGRSTSDPDLLLVWIRNGLAAAGVSFPVFDLALAIYWELARPEQPLPNLVNAWLARSTEAGLTILPEAVQGLREAAEQTVETIPGLGFLLSKGGKWVIDKHKRRYLELKRPDLQELYATPGRPKEPWQLADLLPWMLAQDLNHHLGEHPDERFLLLVDEYEGLFQGGDSGTHWREHPFDKHMRAFVSETDGLLAVFGSRRMLPWGEDADWREDLATADCPLEGLKDDHARDWLALVPVGDQGIADAMLEGAREEKRPDALVYPLLLDLQVAHWRSLEGRGVAFGPEDFRTEAESFRPRCAELAERLMRGFPETHSLIATVKRLCVANRFDRTGFGFVLDHFKTGLPLDFFDELPNLSFITEGDDGWLTMHRAVAEAIAETLPDERRRESVEALQAHFEERATVERGLDVTDETVAAPFEAADLRRQLGAEEYVEWLVPLAAKIHQSARYALGEQLWRDALALCEMNFCAEHHDTATSYNNVASNLHAQGRYTEANPLYRKALEIRERVLGTIHSDTAQSYNNVAYNLQARGRYAKANVLYRKALEIRERVLGTNHPRTATCYNNLALNLTAQGRYAEAEPLHRKALEIRERVLGTDDPSTAASYNNVAYNLNAQRHYAEAEPLYRKALEIRERVLGIDHPSTAASYNNVAHNLNAQGRYAEAEPLYHKALKIRERVLGIDHTSTAASYNNVAYNLNAQGRYTEAEPLYRKALEIRERVLGTDHPRTATCYNNVAHNLNAQSRYAEAESYSRKAVVVAERLLGLEHPSSQLYQANLTALLERLDKKE